ncbi:hypothetical protein N480_22490 [Pseudoalteromonas luteoviolacea S2607]|nr:hypothetical protein N480_22490 [Pseudoalteromonas luteoviolacea S2607]
MKLAGIVTNISNDILLSLVKFEGWRLQPQYDESM